MESGTIGTRPEVLPLSIGDVSSRRLPPASYLSPEVFGVISLQGRVYRRRISRRAQIDRHGNLNSTVIGPRSPRHAAPPAPVARLRSLMRAQTRHLG
jgi:glutaconate CoA-transferase subunit B